MKTFRVMVGVVVVSFCCVKSVFAGGNPESLKKSVVNQYIIVAHQVYSDSLSAAKTLQAAINDLISNPSPGTLDQAKQSWLSARIPYQQSEVYRFGNAVVDDWEGKVNAWPLDEGLIDYVDQSYGSESEENPVYSANVIANNVLALHGENIDASSIDEALIQDLHEFGDVEANVATGYHAIEFLLWGQDLNGTGSGSGNRPWTDFSESECSNGNCARRADYLKASTDLLVKDLEWMTAQWLPGGEAHQALKEAGVDGALSMMLTGMGSLSFGELAGERMKLGLLLHDPEEEHDCFSDNTHNSHYYDVVGIMNVYSGSYTDSNGKVTSGPGLSDLVSSHDKETHELMSASLDQTEMAMRALKQRADDGIEAYDQMIGENNPEGNAVVQTAIDALLNQTKYIEQVVAQLGLETLEIEGSDSLTNPAAVFE